MPNNSDLMQKLLDATVQGLLDRIQSGEATAQDFANARQFLKDNGFTIDPVKGNTPLDDLIEKASKRAPVFPPITN